MTGSSPAVTCIVALSGGYWFTGFRDACWRYWNSEYHAGPIGLAVADLNFSSATLQQAVTNAETKARSGSGFWSWSDLYLHFGAVGKIEWLQQLQRAMGVARPDLS